MKTPGLTRICEAPAVKGLIMILTMLIALKGLILVILRQTVYTSLRYERVYLPLCNVADKGVSATSHHFLSKGTI